MDSLIIPLTILGLIAYFLTNYPSSTPIYFTKDAFIAANLKIEDFNEVEYEAIAETISEFALHTAKTGTKY